MFGFEKPVEPGREVVQNAAVKPVVVQIEIVVAGANLPRAAPAAHLAAVVAQAKEVLVRDHAFERSVQLVVPVVLAREEIQHLHVAAVSRSPCRRTGCTTPATIGAASCMKLVAYSAWNVHGPSTAANSPLSN